MSQQRSVGLSLEELARCTEETPEQLLRWRSLRLIGAEDQEGFGPEDVEYVRLIQLSFRRGIRAETIVRAEAMEASAVNARSTSALNRQGKEV